MEIIIVKIGIWFCLVYLGESFLEYKEKLQLEGPRQSELDKNIDGYLTAGSDGLGGNVFG